MDNYDNLKIGTLASAEYLETIPGASIRIIDHSSIGKEYSLKYRVDLSAQDEGVLNAGADDDSDVYEVVITYDQTLDVNIVILKGIVDSINSILEGAKDLVTNTIGTIDTEHREIHEGHHFFNSIYIPLAGSGVLDLVIETGNKNAHVTFDINSADAGFVFTTYEGVTANADGTLQTLLNNRRESLEVSSLAMRLNPTSVVPGSNVIRSGLYGTAGGTAGSVSRGNEVIFKKNTKYLLRVTNLSTSINNINITHNWYEV